MDSQDAGSRFKQGLYLSGFRPANLQIPFVQEAHRGVFCVLGSHKQHKLKNITAGFAVSLLKHGGFNVQVWSEMPVAFVSQKMRSERT
jgi:hypothetical protein